MHVGDRLAGFLIALAGLWLVTAGEPIREGIGRGVPALYLSLTGVGLVVAGIAIAALAEWRR